MKRINKVVKWLTDFAEAGTAPLKDLIEHLGPSRVFSVLLALTLASGVMALIEARP
ncbi:hypothetical protein [Catenuloplanes indicus]|uniref:Uncharacterized protein n=1 Tax=Catenuloplanes indicus TaxID=137267 RepID=A0AAE3W836_9ACTN|nr:hypothetical protein [Catenuloplanes indicus]MDQ0371588.1 hypothetical protein [Catenuloplanes indicus]